MATNETLIASWSGGSGYSRTDAYEANRNNEQGWLDVAWWVGSRGTWASISGTWDFTRYGGPGTSSGSVGAATGIRGVQSGTHRLYCDANGHFPNFGIGMYWDMFYGKGDAVTNIGFSRAPLAPGIVALISDNIRVSSARLGMEINGYGHGTSASMTMYYRKQGDANWIHLGDQADAGGYNYWTVTGLKQATTYEYYTRTWNNMNDASQSGVNTFKTKSATNLLASLVS